MDSEAFGKWRDLVNNKLTHVLATHAFTPKQASKAAKGSSLKEAGP